MILSSVRIETDRRQDFCRINQLIYFILKMTMPEHTQWLSSIHVNVRFVQHIDNKTCLEGWNTADEPKTVDHLSSSS